MSLPVEEFMTKFQELKRRVNSRPHNVVWMARNDPNLKMLAAEICGLENQINREIVSEKLFSNLPSAFPSLYREFHSKYYSVVFQASSSLIKKQDEEFVQLIEDNLEKFKQVLRDKGIDPCAPEEFDPMKDDPVSEFELALATLGDMVDVYYDDDLGDSLNKGITAWDFLCDKIGINLSEIWKRWQAIPITFIPRHVSDHHGLTEAGSLYDQLGEAHRAYTFGCEAAAITLCRALIELVLRKHYGCEGKDLEEVISFAEQKHRFVGKLELQKKRRLANDILHSRSKAGQLTAEQVQSYMDAVKTLIEQSPKR